MRHPASTIALPAALLLLLACRDDTATSPGTFSEAPDAPDAALVDSWSPRAPMPTGRTSHVAESAENRAGNPILYVFGGYDSDAPEDLPLSTVEAYDYSSNSWSPRASAPYDLLATNGIGRLGGKLYLPGGGSETGSGFERHGRLAIYDPLRNSWTRGRDMPQPSSDGLSGVIDGRLYVLTGGDNVYLSDGTPCSDCGTVLTRRLFRYNPATDRWASRRACPNFHYRGAGGVIDGKLYVAGGLEPATGGTRVSRKLDIYDPSTDRWTSGAPMPIATASATGVVLGGKLYVLGAQDGATLVYNPRTDRWVRRAPLLTPRFNLAAAKVVVGGQPRILAVGGVGNTSDAGHANEAYTP